MSNQVIKAANRSAAIEALCRDSSDRFLKVAWLKVSPGCTSLDSKATPVHVIAYIRATRGIFTSYMSELYDNVNTAKDNAANIAAIQRVDLFAAKWGHLADPWKQWDLDGSSQSRSVEAHHICLQEGATIMGAAAPHPGVLKAPYASLVALVDAHCGTLDVFPVIDEKTGRACFLPSFKSAC